MNVVREFNRRSCDKYRQYFDAYLDSELLVETNQDVLQHLASCAACKSILDDRAFAKQLVKAAVRNEAAPPELAASLRNRLHSQRRIFFGYEAARWPMAAAAVLLAAVALCAVLQWGRIIDLGGQGGVAQIVSERAQRIFRVGLVDHVHCAILSKQWKRFLSFDEMKSAGGPSALGLEFIDLVPAVQAKLGDEFKIVLGHRCTANHRHYIHLIATGRNNAVFSLVITEKENESFARTDVAAVVNASGVPIYRERQGALEVAGFESGRYLAYVISNLDRQSNLRIATAVAPAVYLRLHERES